MTLPEYARLRLVNEATKTCDANTLRGLVRYVVDRGLLPDYVAFRQHEEEAEHGNGEPGHRLETPEL
jgi:hypothetical protein